MRADRSDSRHWPALDGIRAVAVLAVVAYHLGHLGGGWLGVDMFFVLSGYLITSLLLAEHQRTGRVGLAAFWARRARRLLPAVLALLVVLAIYARFAGPGVVPAQLRAPSLATLFYGANWQQLATDHSYFAQFELPSPLVHTWSLAVEEQYYLLWPLAFLLMVRLAFRSAASRGSRLSRRSLRKMSVVTWSGAVMSAAWMGVAANAFGVNRAYLGTDTRAWELLLGGAAAITCSAASGSGVASASVAGFLHRRSMRLWRTAVPLGALIAAGVLAVAAGPPMWLWDGGLPAFALAVTVVVVGVVRDPDGPVARALSLPPMRWLGRVSYSLYLWHWPVIVLMTQATTGLSGWGLLVSRAAAMLAATCASFYIIERPVRSLDWSVQRRLGLIAPVMASAAALLVFATIAPAQAGSAPLAAVASGLATGSPLASGRLGASYPARAPSASDPLRAWIFGDSVMNDGSPGVTAALEATRDVKVVANSSFGGWGLSTDHVWPSDAKQIIAQYRPEVVIGTWSWDTAIAVADPVAYGQRLEAALATLLTPGDGVDLVALVEYPQTGPPTAISDPALREARWASLSRAQAEWDLLARGAVAQFPRRAIYVPTAAVFAPRGKFLTWMRTARGDWVRARKLDNAHFCPFGAATLGALVQTDLAPVLRLDPPSAGWESGAWVNEPRFNDPPGACPADQPPPSYAGVDVPS